MRGLLTSLAAETFELDNRIVRSLVSLAVAPGQMTREYLAGRRAAFTHPAKLVLFAVALLAAVLQLTGTLNGDTMIDTALVQVAVQLPDQVARAPNDPVALALRAAYQRELLEALPWVVLIPVPAAVATLALVRIRRDRIATHVVAVLHATTFVALIAAFVVVTKLPIAFLVAAAIVHGWLAVANVYQASLFRAAGQFALVGVGIVLITASVAWWAVRTAAA